MIGPSKIKKVCRKLGFPCVFFSSKKLSDDPVIQKISNTIISTKQSNVAETVEGTVPSSSNKNLCAICLEPLNCGSSTGSNQATFTGQCSHTFHFVCISSNVRHGSVTCPICRAYWTHLPRDPTIPVTFSCQRSDPVLRILDDSIATSRIHRRSTLLSARYDDDDPIDPVLTHIQSRLHLALIPIPLSNTGFSLYDHPVINGGPSHFYGLSSHEYSPCHLFTSTPSFQHEDLSSSVGSGRAYLTVKLTPNPGIDLVVVVNTSGPHLRLFKQSLALVVFSLRPVDRLALVSYTTTATRAFPLRRMSSQGKRAALQVIDRMFHVGETDPNEGIKKGIKILEDRSYKNPECCILQLSDGSTSSLLDLELQSPIQIHQYDLRFSFAASNEFIMHEFEDFLFRLLGGMVRETQLSIGDDGQMVNLGELRNGEERRIALELGECGYICVGYSYIECGIQESLKNGETVVSIGDKGERSSNDEMGCRDLNIIGARNSIERWDYHDPYMARRWAKHLHGYKL